jgi:hypothetical protein
MTAQNSRQSRITQNGCLRMIDVFWRCTIQAIEIPASVESIKGFKDCSPLLKLIFAEGTQIKEIKIGQSRDEEWNDPLKVLVSYEEKDLKKSRHQLKTRS